MFSERQSQILKGLIGEDVARAIPGGSETLARPARLTRLQLVEVNEHPALLVLVLQQSQVRQQIVSFAEPVDQARLGRLSGRLTDLFRGLSRAQVEARTAGLTGEEALVAAA